MSTAYGPMFSSGVQVKWNASTLKTADACQRRYYYEHILGLRGGGASAHLIFGGHYAKAMQTFYINRAKGASRADALDAAVAEALVNSYIWDNSNPDAPVMESDHNLKTRWTLIRSIVWYFDEFENDLEVLKIGDAYAVELQFALPVDNDNILVGQLDRVVSLTGDKFIMDQKTTGSAISAYYFDQYSPDMQMSQYTWAGQIVFNSPIKGVIIDAAQIAVGFTRFGRGMTFRTQSQLNEWYDDTMLLIERTQRNTREQYFPMTPASCGNYGGCPFRRACAMSPEARHGFLRTAFTATNLPQEM
jgi:hypothetical protein